MGREGNAEEIREAREEEEEEEGEEGEGETEREDEVEDWLCVDDVSFTDDDISDVCGVNCNVRVGR